MTPTALLVMAALGFGKEFGSDAVKQLDTVLERLIKINANEFDKLVKQVIEEFGQWRKKAVTGVISEISTWRKGNVQVFQDELVPNMMSWLRNETQQWREQTSEPMVAAVRDLSSAADMSKLPLKEAAEVVQSALVTACVILVVGAVIVAILTRNNMQELQLWELAQKLDELQQKESDLGKAARERLPQIITQCAIPCQYHGRKRC